MIQYDLLLKDLSATGALRGANLLLETLLKALGLIFAVSLIYPFRN
jgi:hypothetical protein